MVYFTERRVHDKTGALPCDDGDRTIVVDTPSGPMDALARVKESRVQSVAIRMAPSFVHGTDRELPLPDGASITVEWCASGDFSP